MHQSATEIEPPFHSARVLFWQVVGTICETDAIEDMIHPLLEPVALQTIGRAPITQVIPGRKVFINGQLLRNDTQ